MRETSNNISLKEVKKNITKFEDALKIIENSEIYEYNFKSEYDTQKRHIGFVIGDGYITPDAVIAENRGSIENYSMSSINWRATQQVLEVLKELKKRVKKLEVMQSGRTYYKRKKN